MYFFSKRTMKYIELKMKKIGKLKDWKIINIFLRILCPDRRILFRTSMLHTSLFRQKKTMLRFSKLNFFMKYLAHHALLYTNMLYLFCISAIVEEDEEPNSANVSDSISSCSGRSSCCSEQSYHLYSWKGPLSASWESLKSISVQNLNVPLQVKINLNE